MTIGMSKLSLLNEKCGISCLLINLSVVVCNHSLEIQMAKTLAAILDDSNNKANKNSFVNRHPKWRR